MGTTEQQTEYGQDIKEKARLRLTEETTYCNSLVKKWVKAAVICIMWRQNRTDLKVRKQQNSKGFGNGLSMEVK